ncbi:maleylpyruvate isomerase family mycothiol-dependent enzyme [Microtetraspora sp. NBRC 16547]|uniref:maleylpyruvate isomerase family mycothiol-dependent enzyme n=1 Tax=Microtetraspora sp. NBRC 16547 TaxID=3030993 RepID=UPI0025550F65|nr:maleylpyruvate isomerase family mycothiol-dependent enzyme [Microtetraspora sp. NBRC 16547]
MDTWQMIRAERASLANALAALPDADWDRPSLCADWTVRDVVGHMIATANMTPVKFFSDLAASGFRFEKMTAKNIRRVTAGKTDRQLVDLFRSRVDARTAPPGPTISWLGEMLVHGEDIFRALDGYRDHPVEHVLAVADFYKTSNLLIGAKRRIAGVALRATDADWRHGAGPLVSGPAIALLLAMTGRKVALDDLTGDGVAVLRERP